jgi:hypothetical protein
MLFAARSVAKHRDEFRIWRVSAYLLSGFLMALPFFVIGWSRIRIGQVFGTATFILGFFAMLYLPLSLVWIEKRRKSSSKTRTE